MGEEDKFHHENKLIDPACVAACHTVFVELSKQTLLERCVGAYSQNPNESFNNIIWSYCPKSKFCGRRVVEIGTNMAVLGFNDGQQSKIALYDQLELRVGSKMAAWTVEADEERLSSAKKRAESSTKEARQARRLEQVRREEMELEEEGLLYSAGGF